MSFWLVGTVEGVLGVGGWCGRSAAQVGELGTVIPPEQAGGWPCLPGGSVCNRPMKVVPATPQPDRARPGGAVLCSEEARHAAGSVSGGQMTWTSSANATDSHSCGSVSVARS